MSIRASRARRSGLGNFASWLPALARNNSPMDLDFFLHDGVRGRFLVGEFKGPGEAVPAGQVRALKALNGRGVDVFFAMRKEPGRDTITVWVPGRRYSVSMDQALWGGLVRQWHDEGRDLHALMDEMFGADPDP